jgi:hypothetical protein
MDDPKRAVSRITVTFSATLPLPDLERVVSPYIRSIFSLAVQSSASATTLFRPLDRRRDAYRSMTM